MLIIAQLPKYRVPWRKKNKVKFYGEEGHTYALEVIAGPGFGLDEAATFELMVR